MARSREQMQLQAYGEMQHTLRKMTKEEKEKYAAPGTPEHAKYQAKIAAKERRTRERDKAIADFRKTRPQRGSLKGLTTEDVHKLAEIDIAWQKSFKAFMAELDKTMPAIEI